MKKLINIKDAQGKAADTSQNIYVILSDNGQHILEDPVKQGPWWSYSIQEATLQKKIIEKDFNRLVHIVKLPEAIATIARNRYGIELKKPFTYTNISKQITERIIK